jgi:hypothetical protein
MASVEYGEKEEGKVKVFTRSNGGIQPLQLYSFLSGWLYLAQGVVTILSLGFYAPDWQLKFAIYNLFGHVRRTRSETIR